MLRQCSFGVVVGLRMFAAWLDGVLGSWGLLIRLGALLEALQLEGRSGLAAGIS